MPVARMRNVLTRREFYGWLSYFSEPNPDIPETQMATLSLMVAHGLGSKDAKIEDFLIRKPSNKQKEEKSQLLDPDTVTPTGVLSQNEVMSVFAGIATPLDG